MERQEFVDKYVEIYVKNWTELVPLMRPGEQYTDQPNSTVRLVALTTASALWEMLLDPGT